MSVTQAPVVPLSVQQQFLCLWDKGDDMGPFGPRFHIVDGWRIRGRIDPAVLQAALDDVVVRHEALRTTVVRDGAQGHQRILEPRAVPLEVRELPATDPVDSHERDLLAEELLNEIAADTISVRRLPLLRAVLGRFDEDDAVLALIAHHTAVDAWSMQVILRDLAAFYAARAGFPGPALPEAPQYREYAQWQRTDEALEAGRPARAFWRSRLDGARALALPSDRLRSREPVFSTAWHRFSYGPDLCSATAEIAIGTRSSAFIVLLAAFNVFLQGETGENDIVVPTFTPGRSQARFQEAVGSFFNFLPLRTDLAGCATFRDVVQRTRATCLEAYTREIPLAHVLEEAPALMERVAVDGLASCVFQVIQTPFTMDREAVGPLEYSAIRRKVLSQSVGSDIPDGLLLCLEVDASGDLIGELGYSTNLYDESTVHRLVAGFRGVLAELLAAPDTTLTDLRIRPTRSDDT
ncbi:Linear gramicidin synthase subunit B (plasmid) [Streptomyces sp. ADI95-16]|uniref:condensation domain-containing protein n=1 Tax=unclassified Streptomyces TaxID=2593676 RepID=UPI000F43863B|nr:MULTISPECIES: condensation domain-containing protein [unclassified Streptomyces]AYV33088.1 Linear gramicidin synthase subunit B [Streptomyces sp. ADI95-16]RPK24641.1 Linear gramicidin synthase subunit B [Streptomyces sp. ADI91-18]